MAPVEITRAESAKFNRSLLLVHGLWGGAWVWQRMVGYLAHRGWDCFAFARPPAGAAPAWTHDALIAELERVARGLSSEPVVVTHDTGLLAAAHLATRLAVPAIIAVAPIVSPADGGATARRLFAAPQFWRARLVGSAPPPRGATARAYLGAATASSAQLMVDSGPLFRALARGRVRLPARIPCPGLVLSGGRDAISPPSLGAALASGLGWSHSALPEHGHFPMLETGAKRVADELHRWIIRVLGVELLALFDEAHEET